MKTISIINGPNLNLLGRREQHIYGNQSFDEFYVELKKEFSQIKFNYRQSNHEGKLIDYLQAAGFEANHGIILNAAGYTHTSIALGDTVAAISAPVVEVHISNIYNREPFRHHSYVKPHAMHFICGLGLEGYRQAVIYLLNRQELDAR